MNHTSRIPVRRAASYVWILMALASITLSLWTAHHVTQYTPWNADETSYLFQAHSFRDGIIRRPWPVNEDAFNSGGIVIDVNRGWFSRYPFGHALFLVPGILLGNSYLWVAMSAGISMGFIVKTGSQIGGKTTGAIAGLLLLISPFFIIYHANLLSHSSGLLSTSILLWSYLRWQSDHQRKHAIIAGLAWAILFNIRTYTAVLFAIPFGLHALWSWFTQRKTRSFTEILSFALPAFSGVPAILIYNWLTTGKPKRMTYHMYNPTETLGFGPRIYGRVLHTPARGWDQLLENTRLLDLWLYGIPFSLVVICILFLIGWKKNISFLLAASIFVMLFGYIAFWYKGPQNAGPGYYFELLPFLVLGAALGLSRIASRFHPAPVYLGLLAIGFQSYTFFHERKPDLQADVAPRRAILDKISTLEPDTLLFICRQEHQEAFYGGNDMIFNPRGLDSSILIAKWNPDTHRAMIQRFPDRTPLRLIRDEKQNLSIIPALADLDQPIHLRYAMHLTPNTTGTNQTHPEAYRGLARVANENNHPPGWKMVSDYRFVPPGSYALICQVEIQAEDPSTNVLVIDIAKNYGKQILEVTPLNPTSDWREIRIPFQIDSFALIEPRVWYSGKGSAKLHTVRVVQME